MIKIILSIALVASSYCTYASKVLSASCSEPNGMRYDLVGNELKQDSDKFSGVNPQFVLSSSNPNKLTVIWPDSKELGELAKQQVHEALIIDTNETMISAIALYENRVNLYTLFPSKGIGFMSTHKSIPIQSGIPSGSLFKMECKFESS